jgi:hypothetical protein
MGGMRAESGGKGRRSQSAGSLFAFWKSDNSKLRIFTEGSEDSEGGSIFPRILLTLLPPVQKRSFSAAMAIGTQDRLRNYLSMVDAKGQPALMKTRSFLWVLAFLALWMNASGLSPTPQELIPGKESKGAGFEMSSEALATGEIRFTARVRFSSSFSSEDYEFDLADVKVVRSEKPGQGSVPVILSVESSVHRVRKVTAQQDGDVVTCTFTVTKEELADPLLSFAYYKVPREVRLEAPFVHFARLAKYLELGK